MKHALVLAHLVKLSSVCVNYVYFRLLKLPVTVLMTTLSLRDKDYRVQEAERCNIRIET